MTEMVPAAFYDRYLVGMAAYYLAASIFTLLVYGVDKLAAIKGWYRVREDTLHLLSLLGGWPGAYLAQRWFRHKTRKMPFRRVFRVTLFLNLALLLWLLSPYGATWVYHAPFRMFRQ
mgnify:CR=1 FL=1